MARVTNNGADSFAGGLGQRFFTCPHRKECALALGLRESREALELAYVERCSEAQSVDLATIMSTLVTTRPPAGPVGPEGRDQTDPLEWPPEAS